MKQLIFLATAALLGVTHPVLAVRADDKLAAPQVKVRIVLAGDSTVTDNAGWGMGFKN